MQEEDQEGLAKPLGKADEKSGHMIFIAQPRPRAGLIILEV